MPAEPLHATDWVTGRGLGRALASTHPGRYVEAMTQTIPAGQSEWRLGWPVVAAAMIGIGTGPGLFQNLSSLFTPGMIVEFGWTRGEIATASGVGLLGGFAAPFLG